MSRSQYIRITIALGRVRAQKAGIRLGCEITFIPYWVHGSLTCRPVRNGQLLSPKSKTHIPAGLLHSLWNYAMSCGDVETVRNTINLVSVEGATKRTRKPRSLPVEEFPKLLVAVGDDTCWRRMLLGHRQLRVENIRAARAAMARH
jgi:hypothetical protein